MARKKRIIPDPPKAEIFEEVASVSRLQLFLMTYGWVVLVIVAAIIILVAWHFGALGE
jgi:hypothetical protein